ncbi:MAG: hypothetical protein NVSMB31_05050 [Vulcanimicrobiaceae bacterium]
MLIVLALFDGFMSVAASAPPGGQMGPDYVLGPEDQISIHVVDFEEIPDKPTRIDPSGAIDLPLLGHVEAAGLTTGQLRDSLIPKLRRYVKEPRVSINVIEFHSQPVSVLGAVNTPGVHQIEGPRRLLELISMAGGLRTDAGSRLTITRQAKWGPLPLSGVRNELGGNFSVADLDVTRLLSSKDPSENIFVRPNDVITISTAELIYVIGEVKKPGGFTLHSHESVSVLQALAIAEGLERTAAPRHARILRATGDGGKRTEIAMDLSNVLSGNAPDVPLQANDILVIPNNVARNVALRSLATAVQLGTGIVIFRR